MMADVLSHSLSVRKTKLPVGSILFSASLRCKLFVLRLAFKRFTDPNRKRSYPTEIEESTVILGWKEPNSLVVLSF